YTYVEYCRFADDLVVLVDAHARLDWLIEAINKRLREELARIQVEINAEKSRLVDLSKGESFGFWALSFAGCGAGKGSGDPTTRRSSNSGPRWSGSSKTSSVASNPNP